MQIKLMPADCLTLLENCSIFTLYVRRINSLFIRLKPRINKHLYFLIISLDAWRRLSFMGTGRVYVRVAHTCITFKLYYDTVDEYDLIIFLKIKIHHTRTHTYVGM